MYTRSTGFTLLEIAIVSVIIALLIGAIMAGKNIVRNSKLQSIISDVEDYKQATKLFRDKYKYYPGDFPNATAMWGAQAGCSVNSTGSTSTCNGNGDGYIASSGAASVVTSAENYYAWKHLANAGLLKITYDPNGYGRPAGKLENTMYTLFHTPPVTGMSGTFNARYNHIIVFGAKWTSANYPSAGAALTGIEALSIDNKIDDSKPGMGSVLTYTTHTSSPVPSCASSTSEMTAIYNVSSGNTANCSLIFITGF